MADEIPTTDVLHQKVELPVKAVLILFLPVSYVGGFLALSGWANDEGLGFLSFSTPRYLAAGIPIALVTLGTWTLSWVMDATAPPIESPTWRRRLRRVGTDTLSYLLILTLIISIYATFAVQGRDLPMAAIAWLVGITMFLILNFISTFIMVAFQYLGSRGSEGDEYVTIEVPTNVYHWTKNSGLAGFWAFLTILFIVSSVLLPVTPTAFGGAKSRDAVFAIEQSGLTDREAALLLQNGNFTSNVHPSVVLRVVAETEASFIVEIPYAENSQRSRVELSRDIVHSVEWLS